jgi:hypothetical protein
MRDHRDIGDVGKFTRIAAEKSEEAEVLRRQLTKERFERVRMEEQAAHRYCMCDHPSLVLDSNVKTKIIYGNDNSSTNSSSESTSAATNGTSSENSTPRDCPVHSTKTKCSVHK